MPPPRLAQLAEWSPPLENPDHAADTTPHRLSCFRSRIPVESDHASEPVRGATDVPSPAADPAPLPIIVAAQTGSATAPLGTERGTARRLLARLVRKQARAHSTSAFSRPDGSAPDPNPVRRESASVGASPLAAPPEARPATIETLLSTLARRSLAGTEKSR